MSAARPTLGYPSRAAAIFALRAQGKTEKQIAKRLGIKPNSVTSMECRARQRNARRPCAVPVNPNLYADLQREAMRRQMNADDLANQLLRAVVHDNLFVAVLDELPQ